MTVNSVHIFWKILSAIEFFLATDFFKALRID